MLSLSSSIQGSENNGDKEKKLVSNLVVIQSSPKMELRKLYFQYCTGDSLHLWGLGNTDTLQIQNFRKE